MELLLNKWEYVDVVGMIRDAICNGQLVICFRMDDSRN